MYNALNVHIHQIHTHSPNTLTHTAPERLCVNVTSSLIQIMGVTLASWRQELLGRGREGGGEREAQLEEAKSRTHRYIHSQHTHSLSVNCMQLWGS